MPANGYLALILHAHLPYVRHPEHEDFLEEDWLYEAITETYLPLLDALYRMAEDGVPFALTQAKLTADQSTLTNIDGGVRDGAFYLASGGDIVQSTPLGSILSLKTSHA